ncbi:MAG: hypothetical protein V1774_12375 [Candidatus Eisenbacteria bacterium]
MRISLIIYLGLTLVGLFAFRGVPILNIALGFPIGAAAAWHAARSAASACPTLGTAYVGALRSSMTLALTTAAVTVIACWAELGGMLLVLHLWGPYSAAAAWIPLLPPPPDASASRILLFAVLTAPALQVLTTAFGALIAVILRSWSEPEA